MHNRYVKSTSAKVLNDISVILKEYVNAIFSIEGYLNSSLPIIFNKILSGKIADVVKVHLVDKVIDTSRLETTGVGEVKPLDINKTKESR